MSRWVALLLALVLPLQLAWGQAAAYCQHESMPRAVQHVGHHEHAHQADEAHEAGQAGKAAKPSAEKAQAKLTIDNDCGVCHAAGLSAIGPAAPGLLVLPQPGRRAMSHEAPYDSASARAPDRPQWLRLA